MYEKELECYHTAGGLAFFDDRGWGELVPGTAIHFPVPGTELLTLLMDIYTFGGEPGQPGSAPDEIIDFDFNNPEAVRKRVKTFKAIQNAELNPRLFAKLH
jgi:hypothetical protein